MDDCINFHKHTRQPLRKFLYEEFVHIADYIYNHLWCVFSYFGKVSDNLLLTRLCQLHRETPGTKDVGVVANKLSEVSGVLV